MALAAEISGDPLGRGYVTMSDAEVADDLNTEYRTSDRASMSASEVYQAIDRTEFLGASISDGQRQEIYNILFFGEVNPFGKEVAVFVEIFGSGPTITALQAARKTSISRAEELGIRKVSASQVATLRAA